MADTIREKIIAHIYSTLDNYASFSALGSPSVHRGLVLFDPNATPPPLVTVLPRPEDSERSAYETSVNTMQIDITALARIGSANPSELGEAILGELILAVFSSIPTDASDIFYVSGGIDKYPDQLNKQVLTVGITINVVYETDIGDPYTSTY